MKEKSFDSSSKLSSLLPTAVSKVLRQYSGRIHPFRPMPSNDLVELGVSSRVEWPQCLPRYALLGFCFRLFTEAQYEASPDFQVHFHCAVVLQHSCRFLNCSAFPWSKYVCRFVVDALIDAEKNFRCFY